MKKNKKKILKSKKRICAMVLIATIVFSALISVNYIAWAGASPEEVPTYNEYLADYTMNYSAFGYFLDDFKLPYRSTVEDYKDDLAWNTLVNSYSLITFQTDNIVMESPKQTGYYEAILYEMLYEGKDNDDTIDKLDKAYKGMKLSMFEKMSTFMKNRTLAEVKDAINKGDDEAAEELYGIVQGTIKNSRQLEGVLSDFNKFGSFLSYCSDFEDFIDRLSKMIAITDMPEETASILQSMKTGTSNINLQLALDEFAKICSGSLTDAEIAAWLGVDYAISELYDKCMDKILDGVVDSLTSYGYAIKAGQAIGQTLSEGLFATDASIDHYFKMYALYQVEDALRSTVKNYESSFRGNKSESNAVIYNQSCNMMINVLQLGFEYTEKWAKINNEEGLCNMILKCFRWKNYEAYLTSLQNIGKELDYLETYRKEYCYNNYLDEYDLNTRASVNVSKVATTTQTDMVEKTYEELKQEIFLCNNHTIKEDFTLTADMTTWGDLYVEGGTLDLNGYALTIGGNVEHSRGTVEINKGSLTVKENYNMQKEYYDEVSDTYKSRYSTGLLIMKYDCDAVKVEGNFMIDNQNGGDHTSRFTAGTMTVCGDFAQKNTGGSGGYGFNASGSHKVIFDGDSEQMISFASPSTSGFAKALFPNKNIKIVTAIRGWTLDENTEIHSDIPGLRGIWDLSGNNLTIDGNFTQDDGTVKIGTGDLTVTKNYEITGDGTYSTGLLCMEDNGTVKVEGNFLIYNTNGGDSTSRFTAGTMTVCGDFIQKYTGAWRSESGVSGFNASGSHKVIFAGNRTQNIHFDTPSYSQFNDVRFDNSDVNITTEIGGWTMQSDAVINGDIPGLRNTLNLNGHTLEIKGDFIQDDGTVEINKGKLEVGGDYRLEDTYQEEGTGETKKTYSTGFLNMKYALDEVKVEGNFLIDNQDLGDSTSRFTAGTMTVCGDFIQKNNGGWGYGFNASGSHKVIFDGDSEQMISFASPSTSGFAKALFPNKNIKIVTAIRGWTLDEATEIHSDIPGFRGTWDLSGNKLTIDGNFMQDDGTVKIGTGDLTVTKNYEITGEGTYSTGLLLMEDDGAVKVEGDFLINNTNSSYTTSRFTAGTMTVCGDFTQKYTAGYGEYGFNASGMHTVILLGKQMQKVNFESYPHSHFNNLKIVGDINTNYQFTPDNCWNSISIYETQEDLEASLETEKPSETEEPDATKEPGTTENPSETNQPSVTKNPQDTENPTKTEEPSITNPPSMTKEPQGTSNPMETNQPGVTKDPQDTENPTKTKEPSITNPPSMTKEPQGTSNPMETNQPRVTKEPQDTKSPAETETPSESNLPSVTKDPQRTSNPTETNQPINATEKPEPSGGQNATNSPLTGTVLKDSINKVSYIVNAQGKEVAFYRADDKAETKMVIPATVSIKGIKYKVTAISDNAFSRCKKLKVVTIGKNVTKIGNKAFFKCTSLSKIVIPTNVTQIGKKAFYGCKKLKSIIIKTKKLKSTSVGLQAFKGIYKRVVVKVPKKQKKVYQKWLRKKGITKKMKIK